MDHEQNDSLVFLEVLVPRLLGMFQRFLLPFQASVAHAAAQREVCSVSVRLALMQLLHQFLDRLRHLHRSCVPITNSIRRRTLISKISVADAHNCAIRIPKCPFRCCQRQHIIKHLITPGNRS